MPRLITLTTDFGARDAYVAAIKGVILAIAPDARLVDITHEITPQDVMEGAFVLREAYSHFPGDTIHLVVVDPGVGTKRKPIALRLGKHTFVGPDNGLFALLLDESAPDALVHLNKREFWRTNAPSATFHGRDLFAPVAGHLATGRTLDHVGTPLEALRRLHWALPISDEEGVRGWVVHIDRFGNCITNISKRHFDAFEGKRVKGYVGNAILEGIYFTYGAVESGDPLLLFGSSDRLEIAVNGGNAAELLGIRKGAQINLLFSNREGLPLSLAPTYEERPEEGPHAEEDTTAQEDAPAEATIAVGTHQPTANSEEKPASKKTETATLMTTGTSDRTAPDKTSARLRRLSAALLLIAAAGLVGIVFTQFTSPAREASERQSDFIPFSIQHLDAVDLTVRTTDDQEAEAFIFRQFGRRVEAPQFSGAPLEGAGGLSLGRSARVPIFRFADRASGAPIIVYAWSYALLDRMRPRLGAEADVLRGLAEPTNMIAMENDEHRALLWRRGDDILLAVAPADVEPLEDRLQR